MYKILLVDDEPEIVESLHELLDRDFSFFIDSTVYSTEAMNIIKSSQIDILVSDIKMPQYNGFELAEEARRTNPDVRVIFLTGYAHFDYAYSAIKTGCDDYILKINAESEIVSAIKRLLDTMSQPPYDKQETTSQPPYDKQETTSQPPYDKQETTDIDIVAYIMQYIKENISSDLSLQKLAEITYYNPSYLSRIFKQGSGVTLTQYIIDTRIDMAKTLLIDTQLKIYEISQQVGFETSIYFNRVFKKQVGSSPQNFRKMYAQSKNRFIK